MKITYFNNTSKVVRQEVEEFISLWKDNTDFIEVNTSGSTGIPKLIRIEKAKMLNSAKMTGEFFNFNSNQTNLMALSPKYIGGMMQIVRSILYDMKLVVCPLNSNPLLDVKNISIDFAAFVPLQVNEMLLNSTTKSKFQFIKNVIIGGAPIAENLNQKLINCSNNIYSTFGMTETISHVALKEITIKNDFYQGLDNIEFDKDNEDRLIISAKHLGVNKLLTNDCINLINNKRFIWKGRYDNVINSGGVKLYPEVIEKKIDILINRRFFISSVISDKYGEVVTLVIEGNPIIGKRLIELKSQIANLLDKYEQPKNIIFKMNFQETKTGKVLKTI